MEFCQKTTFFHDRTSTCKLDRSEITTAHVETFNKQYNHEVLTKTERDISKNCNFALSPFFYDSASN